MSYLLRSWAFIVLYNIHLSLLQNVTLVINKVNEEYNMTCIATGDAINSAIEWVGVDNVSAKISHNYIVYELKPKINVSNISDSLKYGLPPVFDSKWENLTIMKNNESIEFIEKHITVIHISLYFNTNAEVVLNGNICAILNGTETEEILLKNCEKINNVEYKNKSDLSWKHYSIFKREGNFYIKKYNRNNIETHTESFSFTEFKIISYNTLFWKVHRYKYINILKNGIIFNSTSKCLALQVFVCATCNLTLAYPANEDDPNKKVISGDEKYSWKEIKLDLNSTDVNHQIEILAWHKKETDSNTLQIINQIRTCDENDYRTSNILTTNINAACKLVEYNMKPTKYTVPIDNNDSKSCDFFTKYQDILEQKSGYIVCPANIPCFCSIGYKGDFCNEQCDINTWGFGCKMCSQNCLNSKCNKYTGKCIDGCNQGFYGDQCEVENNCSLTIIEIDENSLQLNLTCSLNLVEFTFFDGTSKLTHSGTNPYTITNLKSYTDYNITVIESGIEKALGKVQVKTKCLGITSDNIITNISSSNVTIQLNNYSVCPLSIYIVEVYEDDEIRMSNMTYSESLVIIALEPFSNYTLKIKSIKKFKKFIKGSKTVSINLTTIADVPKIVNVTIAIATTNSALIIIENSSKPTGKNTTYFARCKILKHLLCNENQINAEIYNYTSEMTNITVTNLLPYKKYECIVFAFNEIGIGNEVSTKFRTKFEVTIDKHEFPLNISAKNKKIDIVWPNCTDMKGPLSGILNFTCSNDWCKNSFEANITYGKINIENILYAFSNYSVRLKPWREEEKESNFCFTYPSFTSPSKKPGKIDMLESYSKNKNSISLRWKPPYPQNGILESYNITSCWNNSCSTSIVKDATCQLYDNYTCADLNNLNENITYKITVSAKNMHVAGYGKEIYCIVQTKEEESEEPLNLTGFVNGSNVELSWQHPDKSNGRIQYFNLDFIVKESDYGINFVPNQTKQLYINEIKKKYSIVISELNSSTVYDVYLNAVNTYKGKASKLENIITKPPKPEINEKVTYQLCSNVKCAINIPRITNLSKQSYIFIVFSGINTTLTKNANNLTIQVENEANKLTTNLNGRVVYSRLLSKINETFVVDIINSSSLQKNVLREIFNNSEYKIVLVVVNKYKGNTTLLAKHIEYSPEELQSDTNYLYLLFLLLLLPVCLLVSLFCKKYFKKKENKCPDEIPLTNAQETVVINRSNLKSIIVKLKKNENGLTSIDLDYENTPVIDESQSFEAGMADENKSKNRYKNIVPYDSTRVIVTDTNDTDYINANYIMGHRGEKTYIATQCPTKNTVVTFWNMIWQQKVFLIICLARDDEGASKFYKYYPETEARHGNFKIFMSKTEKFADFTITYFNIKHKNRGDRQITIFNHESWPDHSIPSFPVGIRIFFKHIDKNDCKEAPIVVHCSAGIGRTGSFIMCHHFYSTINKNNFNILEYLNTIRKCRPALVSRSVQYQLVYYVLDELLNGKNTCIPLEEFSLNRIQEYMEYLKSRDYINNFLINDIDHKSYNSTYNQINSPEPRGPGLIYLHKESAHLTDYINAVKIYGLNENNYIATQFPIANTVKDMWRLIGEFKISTVIILQCTENYNVKFWPSNQEVFVPISYIEITCKNQQDFVNYTKYDLVFCNYKSQEFLKVRLIAFKNWDKESAFPSDVDCFYKFHKLYREKYLTTPFTLLCCLDGVTACGLFITADLILQRIHLENTVDICWAIQGIRKYRRTFMMNKKQYKFIYELVQHHIRMKNMNSDHIYANLESVNQPIYENVR